MRVQIRRVDIMVGLLGRQELQFVDDLRDLGLWRFQDEPVFTLAPGDRRGGELVPTLSPDRRDEPLEPLVGE
jgi:hypothetical protein